MEHDIEKIISQKIKAIEGQPIHWRKHEVWGRLEVHQKKVNRLWYYGIAASFLAIMFFGYKNDLSHQQSLEARIAYVDQALNQFESDETVFPSLQEYKVCPEPADIVRPLSRKILANKKSVLPHDSISSAPLFNIALAQDTVVENSILAENTNVVSANTKVKTIMGVIPTETQSISKIKKQKIKFRIFRIQKEESFADHIGDTKLVVARIK
jgi:hypothetical protein